TQEKCSSFDAPIQLSLRVTRLGSRIESLQAAFAQLNAKAISGRGAYGVSTSRPRNVYGTSTGRSIKGLVEIYEGSDGEQSDAVASSAPARTTTNGASHHKSSKKPVISDRRDTETDETPETSLEGSDEEIGSGSISELEDASSSLDVSTGSSLSST